MPSGSPQPFGPWSNRPGRSVFGGQPLTLPQATTLPATSLANTSAYLNGSVNPEGSATSWWFAYGTTPQYGSVTATTAAGSGSLPITVGLALTGLTQGTAYHFALVAQSAAGTVYGTDQSFVAQTVPAVTTATTPLNPYGTPVAQPHFQWPFTLTTSGAKVCEQLSLADVFSQVQAVAVCPQGAVPEIPGFGVPDLAFGQAPLDPAPLIAAIQRWVPDATEHVVSQALGDPNAGTWQLTLTTQVSGTDGVPS